MTMPSERTRALRWAGEFLREVRSSSEVPAPLREQARVILRHYPSSADIKSEAAHLRARDTLDKGLGPWIAPESDLEI
ncbi:BPSL0761 family protein [Rhodoferax sediminis]|uniref:Uncharacterized protein n=1 Tax=Rhodoferax sediminis TaxID=2509614 RepID=A0A515D7R3_9BURK|nr:BPSL0761 family protein [Rhodoferax sediminis]QDL36460.1 hypothetical protein EUB48_03480 [Rhodoferax sediminis]